MELKYKIQYHEQVVKKDIPKSSSKMRGRIRKAIEQKLATSPEMYGKPLRKSAKGYRKLRVGSYRIIFRIEKRTVRIFLIDHRSIVYKEFRNRK